MQSNPIYDSSGTDASDYHKNDRTSSPEQSDITTQRYASTNDLIAIGCSRKSIADNPQYGTTKDVAFYEVIDDIHANRKQKGVTHPKEEKSSTQIYCNIGAKHDETVVYCNAALNK